MGRTASPAWWPAIVDAFKPFKSMYKTAAGVLPGHLVQDSFQFPQRPPVRGQQHPYRPDAQLFQTHSQIRKRCLQSVVLIGAPNDIAIQFFQSRPELLHSDSKRGYYHRVTLRRQCDHDPVPVLRFTSAVKDLDLEDWQQGIPSS